jgi:hypothetical protein
MYIYIYIYIYIQENIYKYMYINGIEGGIPCACKDMLSIILQSLVSTKVNGTLPFSSSEGIQRVPIYQISCIYTLIHMTSLITCMYNSIHT